MHLFIYISSVLIYHVTMYFPFSMLSKMCSLTCNTLRANFSAESVLCLLSWSNYVSAITSPTVILVFVLSDLQRVILEIIWSLKYLSLLNLVIVHLYRSVLCSLGWFFPCRRQLCLHLTCLVVQTRMQSLHVCI